MKEIALREDKLPREVLQQNKLEMDKIAETAGELSISFGYQCKQKQIIDAKPLQEVEVSAEFKVNHQNFTKRSSSYSSLSGAALSANATLANTRICNGLIGEEILPGLDSPRSFRRLESSPQLSRLDSSSSSSLSSISTMYGSLSNQNGAVKSDKTLLASTSAPTRIETSKFLNASDVQMAGGAAGEDRVQAVCSEENGWLFCGVYDGFNGRDAADYLAGTLYENIGFYLHLLEWRVKQQEGCQADMSEERSSPEQSSERNDIGDCLSPNINNAMKNENFESTVKQKEIPQSGDMKFLCESLPELDTNGSQLSSESFRQGVIKCLQMALDQAESDFLYMVEQEMELRPDLVTVGSCVLVVLLHGQDLYTLNLGDSRAVLTTSGCPINENDGQTLKAVQLTETHTVDQETERKQLLDEHPDDPLTIFGGKVKGKLKVTRAFGVGYLKKKRMNNVLMGILRVRNLSSPPYIRTQPSLNIHRVSEHDRFVVIGSDGLFDFFSNDEIVHIVDSFILSNPYADPAKYILEQLLIRAAAKAGMEMEQLMNIPVGRRRKYHDDVTVIIILLGKKQRTTTASTSL